VANATAVGGTLVNYDVIVSNQFIFSDVYPSSELSNISDQNDYFGSFFGQFYENWFSASL